MSEFDPAGWAAAALAGCPDVEWEVALDRSPMLFVIDVWLSSDSSRRARVEADGARCWLLVADIVIPGFWDFDDDLFEYVREFLGWAAAAVRGPATRIVTRARGSVISKSLELRPDPDGEPVLVPGVEDFVASWKARALGLDVTVERSAVFCSRPDTD